VVGSKGKGKSRDNGGRYRDLPDEEERIGDDPDETRRWEQEEQQVSHSTFHSRANTDKQMYVKRQDDTLGVISGTLSTLVSQAGLIGQEVGEQSEYVYSHLTVVKLTGRMLDDLDTRVDHTDSKLRRTTKQLNDFIRKNESEQFSPEVRMIIDPVATRSNWCIGILIVVLIILLLLVILT